MSGLSTNTEVCEPRRHSHTIALAHTDTKQLNCFESQKDENESIASISPLAPPNRYNITGITSAHSKPTMPGKLNERPDHMKEHDRTHYVCLLVVFSIDS